MKSLQKCLGLTLVAALCLSGVLAQDDIIGDSIIDRIEDDNEINNRNNSHSPLPQDDLQLNNLPILSTTSSPHDYLSPTTPPTSFDSQSPPSSPSYYQPPTAPPTSFASQSPPSSPHDYQPPTTPTTSFDIQSPPSSSHDYQPLNGNYGYNPLSPYNYNRLARTYGNPHYYNPQTSYNFYNPYHTFPPTYGGNNLPSMFNNLNLSDEDRSESFPDITLD